MGIAARLPIGPFTPADAAKLGISRSSLYRMVERGDVEQLRRGLFQRWDTEPFDSDLLEAATRAPEATICLTAALAHHDLVDAIPVATDLALPRSTYWPITSTAIKWHSFDRETFDVGRSVIPVEGTGRTIGLYSAPRSIADVLRLRGSEGYEIGIEATRNWLRRRGSHPADLTRIADQLPRASSTVRTALEYLT
jgi:Transcriptional regulator, AbiEi antitoxin